ncbi:RNA-directed DNA polymerase-like protein [Gossypium australe]|uniref:RNA-directed DNA polymerase-like protein n=1 Tax=Gossypium australe TaxID=47621 RepID=A0A5B6W9C0_9ROSI|nr:RNA-directed DNA polymerase-like protein [Gossypium australe]
MLGVDPQVIVHRLNVSPKIKLVKQKKEGLLHRSWKPLDRREVAYPDCVSNVVTVKKANGKWRMNINFTNLNKACLKDSFSFPSINRMVDASLSHKFMNFIDSFSSFNQISMAPENQDKITFVTEEGLLCYRVMSFELKNAGATNMRLVNKILESKVTVLRGHIQDLSETFTFLRAHNMKLNPKKCAFEQILRLPGFKKGYKSEP